MERLTNKSEADKQRVGYNRRIRQGYPRNIPEERFLKLAEYENTGLMPKEIEKLQEQNARLKELLKAASEDIRTWLVSDDCEKVCRESACHCTTVKQCKNICKWRYADEVEEVLKDE